MCYYKLSTRTEQTHRTIPANTETYQWATVDRADNPAHQKKKKVIIYTELSETFNTVHCLELKRV